MYTKVYSSLFFLLSIILISSCATLHKGQVISLDYGRPVPIQDQAIGSASVRYFLGFGGNKTQLLLKVAKDDMINNRPLAPNESYKNVNLDVSRNFYVIFSKLTYTFTADVVQTGETVFNPPKLPDTNLFHYGDSIFNFKGDFKGYFIHERADQMVQYRSEKGKIKDGSKNVVFAHKSAFNDLTLGEMVKFKTEFYSKGKIVSFGYYKLVVLTYDNQHLELDYHLVSPLKNEL